MRMGRSAWALLVLHLVLGLASGAGAAGPFRLEKDNGWLYLASGGERILWRTTDSGIQPASPDRVALADGTVIALAPGWRVSVTRRGGQIGSIPFQEVAREWLDQESLWGGQQQANDLKYRLRAGTRGELTAISDLTPVGTGALAVLTWRTGGSGFPIAAQYLVRVEVSPQLALAPLRRLLVSDDEAYRTPGPRLFRSGSRLLLYNAPADGPSISGRGPEVSAGLAEITPDGQSTGGFVTFPHDLVPRGLVDERWLVLRNAASQAPKPIWLLDLQTRRVAPLPGDWRSARFGGIHSSIPSDGDHILISREVGTKPDGSDLRTQTFLVKVPSGERRRLPGVGHGRIWKGYVIAQDERGISVYSVKTGKLVQRLPAT